MYICIYMYNLYVVYQSFKETFVLCTIHQEILLLMLCLSSSQHIELLEQKVSSLTSQLEKQYDVHRSGDQRMKQAEGDIYQLQDRLKRAESELASADMLRDSLRTDKERVSQHC